MNRKELLQYLTAKIVNIHKDSPVLVGIDGVDASGKTTLADELAHKLKESYRDVIRASIDGFHNPTLIRYAKGEDSPEGYYLDSFNYEALTEVLLNPLSLGNRKYKTAVFDYRTDSEVVVPIQEAQKDSILIMEGVFLFRPELVAYWDAKIFLKADFTTTLPRVLQRSTEQEHIGNKLEIIRKYQHRYIPGQKIYMEKVNPKEIADVVIDNNDFENPIIIKDKNK